MSTESSTTSVSTPTTAKGKPRGPKITPGRTRYRLKNSRAMKRMVADVEALKGRRLTASERGAAAYLATPTTRDGSTGR